MKRHIGAIIVFLFAASGHILAEDNSTIMARLTSSGSGEKQIIWDPIYDWQRITYHCEIELNLDVRFNTQRGDIWQYIIENITGTVHFWGVAEDNYYGSYNQWDFNDFRDYTILEPAEGLLEYSESNGRVTFVQMSLSSTTGNVRPYYLKYFGLAHPHTTRLSVSLPDNWYFDEDYDNCNPGMGIDLTDSVILSPRAQLSYDANKIKYNTAYPGNWKMTAYGSYLQADFELDNVPGTAKLVIDHLSSSYSECPSGGYSPVDIIVNGQMIETSYDPAENHAGNHGFVKDEWEIGQYLHAGTNSIRVQICDSACSLYWIRYLYIDSLGGDCAKCTLDTIRVTEISVSENVPIQGIPNVIWSEVHPDVFYPVADGEYNVDITAIHKENKISGNGSTANKYYTMPGTIYTIDIKPNNIEYETCKVDWEIIDNGTVIAEAKNIPVKNNRFVLDSNDRNLKIGQYILRLKFRFWDSKGLKIKSPEPPAEFPLFVIHSDKILKESNIPPEEKYLKKAVELAQGERAADAPAILNKFMASFRRQNWIYSQFKVMNWGDLLFYTSNYIDPNKLPYGNCESFARAFEKLATTLGIKVEYTTVPLKNIIKPGDESGSFITQVFDMVPIGGHEGGNAFSRKHTDGIRDRWYFKYHALCYFSDGLRVIWYDPTFTQFYEYWVGDYYVRLLNDLMWDSVDRLYVDTYGIIYHTTVNNNDIYCGPINDTYLNGITQFEPMSVFIGNPINNSAIVEINEGDSGITKAIFNVTLSRPAQYPINVRCYTVSIPGEAEPGFDYIEKSIVLLFNKGQKSQPVEIEIKGDIESEKQESFLVNIESDEAFVPQNIYKPVHYSPLGHAKCIILDNDIHYLDNSITANTNKEAMPSFTDIPTAYGNDGDNDGVFESLAINVNIDGLSGDFYIMGHLKYNSEFITDRKSMGDVSYLSDKIFLSGTNPSTTTVIFSGEDIFRSGYDGTYNVYLELVDVNNIRLDYVQFNTSIINHNDFGEMPLRLIAITEYGIDDNCDGLYDWLAVDIGLNVYEQDEYFAVVSLSIDPNASPFLTENGKLSSLNSNSIKVLFDGRYIRENGINGSYTASITLYDSEDNYVTSTDYTMNAYMAEMFERPPTRLTGNYMDYVAYTGNHCPMSKLMIDVEIDTQDSGSYEICAGLYGSNGNVIQAIPFDTQLVQGISVISFEYDGSLIADNGIDGPYYLGYVAIRQTNEKSSGYLSIYENVHQTQAYTACGFNSGYSFVSGDIDCDCRVEFADLITLMSQWLQTPGIPSGDIIPYPAGDSIVNIMDFVPVAEYWLVGVE